MRIAINARLLLPNRLEGIGRFLHEVTRRLVISRPNDEFILFFDRPFDNTFSYGPNVEMVHLPPPTRHPLLWYLWFEWAIPWALRRYDADVFVSMDNYCSLRSKVPTLMVTHDIAHCYYPDQIPPLVNRFYQYYVPRYLERVEQLVTVSHFCKQDIVQQYGVDPAKIGVACNAPSPAFRPLSNAEINEVRQKYSDGQPYFFYLGAIHPRKNIDRLIKAFDQFKAATQSPVKLLLGGRLAWQSGPLKATYEAARYRDDIQLLGYVSDEDLVRLVGGALALTYISLFEGFGVPIVEAMQAGVPVLTSTISSMPEVADGAALLVDPTDVNAIAKQLQRLCDDPHLRATLINKGLERANCYSWEAAEQVVNASIDKL